MTTTTDSLGSALNTKVVGSAAVVRKRLPANSPMLIIWRPLIETNGSRGGWTHVDSLMIVFQFLSAIVDFRHKTTEAVQC